MGVLLQGIFLTQGSNSGLLHWQTSSLLSKLPGKLRARSPKVVGSWAQDSSAGKLIPAAPPRAPDPRPGQQFE